MQRIVCFDCGTAIAAAPTAKKARYAAFDGANARAHICADGCVRCHRCTWDWVREQQAALGKA